MKENFNIEIDGKTIEDVAEKIGSLFGETGHAIGKMIDNATKDTTIKIETGKDRNERDKK